MHSILSKSTRTTKRIDELREIIHYQDVLFYTWQMMSKILPADKNSDNIYMLNAIELLEITVPPKNENSDGELMGFNNGNIKYFYLINNTFNKSISVTLSLIIFMY